MFLVHRIFTPMTVFYRMASKKRWHLFHCEYYENYTTEPEFCK